MKTNYNKTSEQLLTSILKWNSLWICQIQNYLPANTVKFENPLQEFELPKEFKWQILLTGNS